MNIVTITIYNSWYCLLLKLFLFVNYNTHPRLLLSIPGIYFFSELSASVVHVEQGSSHQVNGNGIQAAEPKSGSTA